MKYYNVTCFKLNVNGLTTKTHISGAQQVALKTLGGGFVNGFIVYLNLVYRK